MGVSEKFTTTGAAPAVLTCVCGIARPHSSHTHARDRERMTIRTNGLLCVVTLLDSILSAFRDRDRALHFTAIYFLQYLLPFADFSGILSYTIFSAIINLTQILKNYYSIAFANMGLKIYCDHK